MLYRIHTEDIKENREAILKEVSKIFQGFTVIEAIGYWDGIQENSLIIEIYCSEVLNAVVKKIADRIKIVNKQDAVLIGMVENCSEYIS